MANEKHRHKITPRINFRTGGRGCAYILEQQKSKEKKNMSSLHCEFCGVRLWDKVTGLTKDCLTTKEGYQCKKCGTKVRKHEP